jgi:glycosyltransferase involved in cell wall biosynthesis
MNDSSRAKIRNAVVLIPAYNPADELVLLVRELKNSFKRIVVVDDGSQTGLENFDKVVALGAELLRHDVNKGKGAALKTGFQYIGEEDVVTADADGQHTPNDIAAIADRLALGCKGLVVGQRAFDGKVPFRSRFGNFWTRWFFFLMTGVFVRDTQTGLRGIPAGLVKRISQIPGQRYEYEMAMLADSKNHEEKPCAVPIKTVYIADNKSSHFNPLLDTIRIYRSLLQFCISSVLSFLIDNTVFAFVVWVLADEGMTRKAYTLYALVASRLISSNFNYLYNRFVVFKGRRKGSGVHRSYFDYWALVIVIAAASYIFTQGISALADIRSVAITPVKILVDVILFVSSYWFQKRFVFSKRITEKGSL